VCTQARLNWIQSRL